MPERTIDQRLDALASDLESLSVTVSETSATVSRLSETVSETSATVSRVSATVSELSATVQETQRQMLRTDNALATLVENSARDGEAIRALARIAEIHERRLTALEGGEPKP